MRRGFRTVASRLGTLSEGELQALASSPLKKGTVHPTIHGLGSLNRYREAWDVLPRFRHVDPSPPDPEVSALQRYSRYVIYHM